MCTGGDGMPGSVAEALQTIGSCLDYLNGPAGEQVEAPAAGEALRSLAAADAKHSAAWMRFLSRFDAGNGHDADGCANSAAWLAGQCRLTPRAAKGSVKLMRLIDAHPLISAALAKGEISESWAAEIAAWSDRLPAEMRPGVDEILLGAAAAGADLDDLKLLANAAWEEWKSQRPDPDNDDDGYDDRCLKLDTTLDGAGRVTGNLTPECAAALQAVLDALGKKRGPEDTRSVAQRFHDALQEGCELLIGAKMVPGRAGAGTRVETVVGLGQLRDLPGGPVLEEAWLAARSGQHGYLAGKDAEVIACDALIVPVVTGSPDWAVIGQMISLVIDAFARHAPTATGPEPGPDPADVSGPADEAAGTQDAPAQPVLPLPAEAWQALQYALAKLAIDFVSGPGALASALRTGLLSAPFNTRSVPLDVGQSATIPDAIRRAVILRDKKCAWPGGCDKPPAACDVHHLKHKKDGGPTSVTGCILLCQYHHDICIHRWGWEIELLPDGETIARSPQGKVIRSHSPPHLRAA